MANGVDLDLNGTPLKITFHLNGGTALPATVYGVQKTSNFALPFLPTRIVWTGSTSTVAGDMVILQDLPGAGGTGTAREITRFIATGASFTPPQEWKRASHEAGWVGCQITQFDSGELAIYL